MEDPCFGEEGTFEVICPRRPDGDQGAVMRVRLEKPVAYATPPPQALEAMASQAWWVETEDGQMCGIKAHGTTAVINGKRVNYLCDDGAGLIGLPTPGKIWTARQVMPAMPKDATSVPVTIVQLRTVWR
jgi:hypothetical protein